ncbi:MAG TPA: allophanate hydrolase [Polyangiaceae bacterium]|nr:allophanate hydrolase [Polyangiaceae bacterium]
MAVHEKLDLASYSRALSADASAPERLLRETFQRAEAAPKPVWIHLRKLDDLLADLRDATARKAAGEDLPLFGVPYALKDNIDVAGLPTTVACPAFAYVPKESAPVVERLRRAGAILLGKTNLDQFASGLVGVRSPYGIVENPVDPRYVSGGSSSGSAVSVSTGIVPFSIGTDTAGSGRVPAAFQGIVGLKPTRGLISARGLVPACRTIDCISVFATNAGDARMVLGICSAPDPEDPFSRDASSVRRPRFARPLRLGVPKESQLEFFGDAEYARLFSAAVKRLEALGAVKVEIDLAPFRAAADLLYGGPWVAERLSPTLELLERDPSAFIEPVRTILENARKLTALDAYEGLYALADARRRTMPEWEKMDVLFLPTAPTIYPIAEILADPIAKNARLGFYTQFANLLDLTAVAVPAGERADGIPFGVSFIGPAFSDSELLALAERFGESSARDLGGLDVPRAGDYLVAVAGAHLSGMPLNHQLTSRRARLVKTGKTAPGYKLYALAGTVPPKPGLVFDPSFAGTGIEIEVWSLDAAAFGAFVDEVPPPLAIGTVTLEDGSTVNGFVCEPAALRGATDVTSHGGWRAYRASLG